MVIHYLSMQHFLIFPGPPYLIMSMQCWHVLQSLALHPLHLRQHFLLPMKAKEGNRVVVVCYLHIHVYIYPSCKEALLKPFLKWCLSAFFLVALQHHSGCQALACKWTFPASLVHVQLTLHEVGF